MSYDISDRVAIMQTGRFTRYALASLLGVAVVVLLVARL
jgi:hypothetical protein